MAGKVFISHSSLDRVQVSKIVADIEKRGIPCWLSSRPNDLKFGEDYQKKIVEAMQTAAAVVLLISDNANRSEEIPREMGLVSRYRKPLIPVKIEDIEPEGGLIYRVSASQFINLYEDYAVRIEELCARLAELMAADGTVPLAPQRNQPGLRTKPGINPIMVAAVLIVAVLGGIGLTQQARLHAMLVPHQATTVTATAAVAPPAASAQPAITPPAAPAPAPSVKSVVEQPAVPAAKIVAPAVATAPKLPAPTVEPGYVAINNTALRATADPYGETVKQIEVGDTVRATPNDQTDPAWIYVTAADGQTGYVSRADLAAQ